MFSVNGIFDVNPKGFSPVRKFSCWKSSKNPFGILWFSSLPALIPARDFPKNILDSTSRFHFFYVNFCPFYLTPNHHHQFFFNLSPRQPPKICLFFWLFFLRPFPSFFCIFFVFRGDIWLLTIITAFPSCNHRLTSIFFKNSNLFRQYGGHFPYILFSL